MTLQDAHVVVVGGSSGIGLATARLAQQRGAIVSIAGRSEKKLAAAKDQLGDVRAVTADITVDASVATAFEQIGRVDHVVVSAGTIRDGRVVGTDLAALRHILDERVLGVVHIVRHVRPLMTQGSITFTSGTLSSRPAAGTAMLTASLAAVEAFAPALALELSPIRVNTVTPGAIDTPLLDAAYGSGRESIVAGRAERLPGRRIGTPEEVAQMIMLCMTNEYINGAVLHVDGAGRFVS